MCKGSSAWNPIAFATDTPRAPKKPTPPPAAPEAPAPPPAPTVDKADVPAAPSASSNEAQQAAADAAAEALQRKKKSTFLTGPGGISQERFGAAQDIKKADLFGGGSRY